jgi:hypothetical protein
MTGGNKACEESTEPNLEELRENVFIDVKSIVFAFKFGCTERELKYEYRQLNNSEIPFRQLGYASLYNFMRTVPHVEIKKNETGDLWVYHAVYDEKTEHIGKLNLGNKFAHMRKIQTKNIPVYLKVN